MKITDYVTIIRERREKECFPVINRGLLWYDRLSKSQLSELERWYQEWLDAPETGKIPAFPTWINAKTEKNVEEILI
jgi:hypothetical protein